MFVWYDAVVQIQLQSEWTLSAEASPAVNLSSRHLLLAGSKKHVSVRRLRQTAFKDPSLSISCWRKASDLTAQQDVCLSVWSWYLNQNTTSFLSDTCSRREVQVKNLITMTESFAPFGPEWDVFSDWFKSELLISFMLPGGWTLYRWINAIKLMLLSKKQH